jgi:O-antigen/teichoic acid export membrane protein
MKSGFSGIVTAVTGVSVRAANQVVIFGVTLVAAHFLAPTDFGVFAIASASIALIRTLMYTGAFEYLLKAPPGEEAPSECLVINVLLSVMLSVVLLTLVPASAVLFGTPAVGHMLLLMAPSNIMSAVAAWQESQVLRAKRVHAYYVITAISEVIAGAGAVVLLIGQFGLMALVGQLYLRCAVLLVAYRLLQRPSWSPSIDAEKLFEIFKWSSSRYGSTMVSFMSSYGADFFLGALLSPAATGVYRASNRVVTAVSDVFSHPTQILGATIFSRYAAQRETPEAIWPRIVGASAFLGWSALAGLAAIAERAVPVILGAQWTGTGLIIALLCAARALSLIDAVTVPLLVAFDKSRSVFHIQFATAIASVMLLCVVARYGVAATAVSAIIISAASTISYCALSLRVFRGSGTPLRNIIPISILPAVMTFLAARMCLFVVPVSVGPLPATGFAIAAGIAAWLAVVAVLRHSAMDALHALNA